MRRVERRRFASVRVATGLAALAVGAAWAGCSPVSTPFHLATNVFSVTTTTAASALPAGPAKAALPGDLVLENDIFRAVVAGASALRVGAAPTSIGALLDLSLKSGFDQLGLITQSVLGLRLDPGPVSTSPGDTPIVWTSVSSVEFTSGPFNGAVGIQCTGRLLDLAILGGKSTFIGAGVTTSSPALPGKPVVTTSNGVDLQVVTNYLVRHGDPYLTIETTVFHTDTSTTTAPINIFSIADLWKYEDPFATSATTTLTTWNPITGKSLELVLATPPVTQIVVPFVAQFGDAATTFATPASYAHFDQVIGQEIHAYDPSPSSKVSVTAELNDPATTTLTLTAPAHWVRHIALGGRNDVASASDIAIETIGHSESARGRAPKTIGTVARFTGTVTNPVLGMTIAFIEFTPSKIFTPAGFIDSPVPDPVLSGSGLAARVWTFAQVDPATGAFSALLPVDFDALSAPFTTGANGVARQYYVAPQMPPSTTSTTSPLMFPGVPGDTVNFTVQ